MSALASAIDRSTSPLSLARRIGGRPGGVLRLFAALERGVQRETIVATGDGFVGLFERLSGGGVLSRGVPFGAGGASGIDSTLGLIDFSLWRRRTRDR